VKVLPIDVNRSGWMCRWEDGGVRLGMRFVKGLRATAGEKIEKGREARGARRFESIDDFARVCRLREDQLTKLADAGALASLGLTRRAAMWQAARAAKPGGDLFETPSASRLAPRISPLRDMSPVEETLADYQSAEITTGPHLLEHFRARLKRDNVLSAADLKHVPNGSRVTTAGAVIVRQRPGTAKGFVFLTLEDETGLSQAIVNPQLFSEWRSTILGHSGLIVEGIVQNGEGQASVRAERFWPLEGLHDVQSYDFH
jgi:error-prone DNA polymerase